MMNYFREGGFPMWVMLLVFVGTVVLAVARGAAKRSRVLGVGAIVQIGLGLMGVSLGLEAVSDGFRRYPGDHTEALGIGLGELANNGTFSCTLALILGVAALVSAQVRDHEAKA